MPTTTNSTDKTQLVDRLKAFASGSFASNATAFFDTLGYRSEKTIDLEQNTPAGLLELANRSDFFNPTKAHTEEWRSVAFLFQLTDEEIRSYGNALIKFDSTVDVRSEKQIESYIFFAVELKDESYPRSFLADITREINRLFPMPALVLFKHGPVLSLSAINRRIHKRDLTRDVLENPEAISSCRFCGVTHCVAKHIKHFTSQQSLLYENRGMVQSRYRENQTSRPGPEIGKT
jgi:adenine-specific DNA-methyltransferase